MPNDRRSDDPRCRYRSAQQKRFEHQTVGVVNWAGKPVVADPAVVAVEAEQQACCGSNLDDVDHGRRQRQHIRLRPPVAPRRRVRPRWFGLSANPRGAAARIRSARRIQRRLTPVDRRPDEGHETSWGSTTAADARRRPRPDRGPLRAASKRAAATAERPRARQRHRHDVMPPVTKPSTAGIPTESRARRSISEWREYDERLAVPHRAGQAQVPPTRPYLR